MILSFQISLYLISQNHVCFLNATSGKIRVGEIAQERHTSYEASRVLRETLH